MTVCFESCVQEKVGGRVIHAYQCVSLLPECIHLGGVCLCVCVCVRVCVCARVRVCVCVHAHGVE